MISLPPTDFKMQPLLLPACFVSTDGILPCDSGEELAQVVQRSGGCPIHGSVQNQFWWGLGQPGILEGVPAHGKEVVTSGRAEQDTETIPKMFT